MTSNNLKRCLWRLENWKTVCLRITGGLQNPRGEGVRAKTGKNPPVACVATGHQSVILAYL